MRTFLDLLPYRFEQLFWGYALRSANIRLQRRLSAARGASPVNERQRRPCLFVDMTVICHDDAGTGIQRVVRELALALAANCPSGWDIQFVAATRKRPYRHIAWPGGTRAGDRIDMCARPGDVFLGLDYSLDAVRRHRRQLWQFRKRGGSLWFLVHDLLPFQRPDWFSPNTVIRYKAWLGILSGIADGFLCNSPQTERELRDVLAAYYGLTQGYRTQTLPMGHAPMRHDDIGEMTKKEERKALRSGFDASTPFALMVGTLEPRKGHAEVVAAFDEMWRKGWDGRLVLVGRLGWKVDGLRDLIRAHPEYGARLLWFDDVGDEELFQFYKACSGVIVASHAEGFGLPVIEALSHGKPVLARDLPIFRMHEGKGLHYFPADVTISVLAEAATCWLTEAQLGTIRITRPTQDWSDSARIMAAVITSRV